MIGEAAALATAFCWSFTSIFFSRSGRRVGSVVVNRTRLVLAIFFLATMHRILLGVWFPTSAEPWRWGWLAASSIVGLVLGDAALFAAFAMIGAQLSMLMMAGVPLMSALLAWLVFGEKMASAELVGALITVAAIGWVVTELS
ncbi:MAG: DMT family transporter, partial [Methylococcales bacterium]|nr:DMT family transporter [Methylococcales bacterium]